MKNQEKQAYNTPEITLHGSLEEITQQSGSGGIDGLTGVDINGDGVPDAGITVTTGSI